MHSGKKVEGQSGPVKDSSVSCIGGGSAPLLLLRLAAAGCAPQPKQQPSQRHAYASLPGTGPPRCTRRRSALTPLACLPPCSPSGAAQSGSPPPPPPRGCGAPPGGGRDATGGQSEEWRACSCCAPAQRSQQAAAAQTQQVAHPRALAPGCEEAGHALAQRTAVGCWVGEWGPGCTQPSAAGMLPCSLADSIRPALQPALTWVRMPRARRPLPTSPHRPWCALQESIRY